MFSTDASFSLHLLARHGSHIFVDTDANIRPLCVVSILSLFSILFMTVYIENVHTGSCLLSCFFISSTKFIPAPLASTILSDHITPARVKGGSGEHEEGGEMDSHDVGGVANSGGR